MRRKIVNVIVILLFCTAATFGAREVWHASQGTKQAQTIAPKKTIAEQASQSKQVESQIKKDWLAWFWERPTDWLLVLFNLILAMYTASLYYATLRMASADRPHLIPSSFVVERIRHQPGEDGKVDLLVSHRLENHGRCPAFVRKYCFMKFTGTLDEFAQGHKYGAAVNTNYIVSPKGWYGTAKPSSVPVSADIVAKILSGEEVFITFGFIEYQSIDRQRHKIRFAFAYEFDASENSIRYYPVGQEKYWEYT